MLEAEWGTYPETAPIPGWHVNTSHPKPEWADKQVFPSSPNRVYAGHKTFYYVFKDEQEYENTVNPPVETDESSIN